MALTAVRAAATAVAAAVALTLPAAPAGAAVEARGPSTLATTTTVEASSSKPGTFRITVVVATDTNIPTGQVEIFDNGESWGDFDLFSGHQQVFGDIAPGVHRFKVVYTPDSEQFLGSQGSDEVTVKGRATISETFPARVDSGERATGKVVVDGGDRTPKGEIEILEGGDVLRRADLERGKVAITLPRLDPGKHKLVIQYAGDGIILPAKKTVRITQG